MEAHIGVEGVERHPSGPGGRLLGYDAGAPPDVQRQRPAQQRPVGEGGPGGGRRRLVVGEVPRLVG